MHFSNCVFVYFPDRGHLVCLRHCMSSITKPLRTLARG